MFIIFEKLDNKSFRNMNTFKTRRKRGVYLTVKGWQRLQEAKLAIEIAQNNGNRFTLEELSDRTQLSTKTLSRLGSLTTNVDRRTLKMCFSAFGLELGAEDYTISGKVNGDETNETLSNVLNAL
jgi:hypothetical protein